MSKQAKPKKPVKRTLVIDPDTGERRVLVTVDMKSGASEAEQAIEKFFEGFRPENRLKSIRSKLSTIDSDFPEKAHGNDALDLAEAKIKAGTDASVELMTAEASYQAGLHRAARRKALKGPRSGGDQRRGHRDHNPSDVAIYWNSLNPTLSKGERNRLTADHFKASESAVRNWLKEARSR